MMMFSLDRTDQLDTPHRNCHVNKDVIILNIMLSIFLGQVITTAMNNFYVTIANTAATADVVYTVTVTTTNKTNTTDVTSGDSMEEPHTKCEYPVTHLALIM